MRPNTFLLVSGLLLGAVGCKRPLSFDAQGVAHGTGERTYSYRSGAVQLREDYVDGELVRSRWFKPDGTVIQETRWQHGTGDGLYLREDGSVRTRQHYVGGTADGPTTEYDASGQASKVETYRHGQPVGGGQERGHHQSRSARRSRVAYSCACAVAWTLA